MNPVKYIAEGITFIMVNILIFTLLSQFLQILNLFDSNQIGHIGLISILLAINNLLTKNFFGYELV